jgi:thiol:disulfide interchange protein DsbD
MFAILSTLTDALQHRPLAALAALFGAGVLTSLNPCIYPMIPITAGVITGRTAGTPVRGRVVGLTLTYVGGLALFYALLGVLAGLTGQLFGTVASSPWARFATGALLVVFGLALWDLIPVRMPQRWSAWAAGLGGGSYPAVFLLGATSGIVAAPCGAPAFAVVLTWVATTGSALLGLVYLFVFSLGMTALLVLVGLSAGALGALPKPGPWMAWVRRVAGGVLLVMGAYYAVQGWETL